MPANTATGLGNRFAISGTRVMHEMQQRSMREQLLPELENTIRIVDVLKVQ